MSSNADKEQRVCSLEEMGREEEGVGRCKGRKREGEDFVMCVVTSVREGGN